MLQPYIEGDMDIDTYYFTPLLLYHAWGKIDNIYCMSTMTGRAEENLIGL